MAAAVAFSCGLWGFTGGRGLTAAAQDDTTFHARVDLTVLTVTVESHDGLFVQGLGRELFHVFENGVEQPIAAFAAGEVPVDLVLLLDTSGSMGARLDEVRHAAGILIQSLHPDDRAAVMSFGGRVTEPMTLTSDRAAIGKAIDALAAGGTTPLYDAVYIALKEFGRAATSGDVRRRALVVLSDGDDTASHIRFDDVLRQAREAGVGIYTIVLRDDPRPGSVRISPSVWEMTTIARETGGRTFSPGKENLDPAYKSIAQELASQYSLGYVRTNRDAREFVRVNVTVAAPNTAVRTRTGYVSSGS